MSWSPCGTTSSRCCADAARGQTASRAAARSLSMPDDRVGSTGRAVKGPFPRIYTGVPGPSPAPCYNAAHGAYGHERTSGGGLDASGGLRRPAPNALGHHQRQEHGRVCVQGDRRIPTAGGGQEMTRSLSAVKTADAAPGSEAGKTVLQTLLKKIKTRE